VRTRFNTDVGEVLFNSAATWIRICGLTLAKLLTMRFLLHAYATAELLTTIISLIRNVLLTFFLGLDRFELQQLRLKYLSWKIVR
jgi:hypothetical protein